MGKLFVVYHSLPFRCFPSSPEGSEGVPSLIPEAVVDAHADVPRRRRRRTRSDLQLSFSSITSIEATLEAIELTPKSNPKTDDSFIIRSAYQHPCHRIPPGDDICYVGLAETRDEATLLRLRSNYNCLPVVVPEAMQNMFIRYCDRILTPLFHYRLFDRVQFDLELLAGWEDVVSTCRLFSETITSVLNEGDRVIILDHRLALLPRMLTEAKQHSIPIAFHLGVPLPTSEIVRCHPKAKDILAGMLGADVIIFQVFSYIRHFMSSCTRVLGLDPTPRAVVYKGLPTSLTSVPVGIDYEAIKKRLEDPDTIGKLENIRKVYRGQRLLLAIDSLETIKGIMHTMEAYEKLLEMEPRWIGDVVLVQVVTSMTKEPKLTDIVSRINNRFGYLGFNPVQLFYHPEFDPAEYLALLRLADVFLVITERSAFSIPALEYIACQEGRYGQLVVSEFIGYSVFMPGVFLVNPWDHTELALTIQDALTVPIDEMIIRHEERAKVVAEFNSEHWFKGILGELEAAHALTLQHLITPVLDTRDIYMRYLRSTKRIFLLDYDGTLVGIKRDPMEAIPSSELIRALRMLCRDPCNLIYIISGREKSWLEKHFGHIDRLGLSAEHGCYLRPVPAEGEHGSTWQTMIIEAELTLWQPKALELMEYYTERTPNSFIERKSASLSWHYRQCDDEVGERQALELLSLLESTFSLGSLAEVISGKKVIEARPKAANKGKIASHLMHRHHPVDFALCVGDDRTDEDMFKYFLDEHPARPEYFTCKVGVGKDDPTRARFGVKSPEQVKAILARLSLASTERSASYPTI